MESKAIEMSQIGTKKTKMGKLWVEKSRPCGTKFTLGQIFGKWELNRKEKSLYNKSASTRTLVEKNGGISMKKVLCALLAVMMCMNLLAGCGKTETTTETAPVTEETQKTEGKTEESVPEAE